MNIWSHDSVNNTVYPGGMRDSLSFRKKMRSRDSKEQRSRSKRPVYIINLEEIRVMLVENIMLLISSSKSSRK